MVKTGDGEVTASAACTVLDDEGRVRELSRMLAGVEESDSARAHAEELLDGLARAGRVSDPTRRSRGSVDGR